MEPVFNVIIQYIKTTQRIMQNMIIRKQYKFEGAHIVRNCSSDRCKRSIHGHSYVVEVFFTADGFDNGMMLLDFGLTKTTIKDFIDSFDHAYSMWDRESDEFQDFINTNSARVITMPVSPSAEAYSLMMLRCIDAIVKNTTFANGETGVSVSSVRVHETTTGYAEAFAADLDNPKFPQFSIEDILFSEQIMSEWANPGMWDDLIAGVPFMNNAVTQQIV